MRLRYGEVSLIGGIIQQTDSKGITGIPGLATLPILGRLFSGENLEKDRTELVIALVPHIVRAPEVGDWKGVEFVTATQIRGSVLSDPASVQAGAEKSVVLAQSPPASAPPAMEISGSSRTVFIPSSIDTQLGAQATVSVFGADSSDNTLISAQLRFDPQLLRIIRVVPEPQKVDIRNDAGRADIQLRPDPATAATAGLFSVVLQAVGRRDTSLMVSGMAPGIVAPDPVQIQIR